MTFLDILPNAIKRLNTNPAETARTVRDIVIRAPNNREGIHEIILRIVA
jgi:hypothetical protein